MLNYSKLKGIIPDNIIAQLPGLEKYGIDGPLRLSHLVGQTMEETGVYKVMSENLNYSGIALWEKFHTHFKDPAEALTFARQPERIANRIYSNRMGNGDEESGDGWKYRGRGALQTTGKAGYQQLSDAVGVDFVTNPDLVIPDYCMISAAVFFQKNNLWEICDAGVGRDAITKLTKKVNGGSFNLDVRIRYTQRVHAAITN